MALAALHRIVWQRCHRRCCIKFYGIKSYGRNFVVNFVRYYSFAKFWMIIKICVCMLHFSDVRMHM
ncbi:hypothetical protein HMPREF3232_01110 [Fannyhessea vaginae]|nr:hypothetical protein HMPREF3232_01110 [Fannyhessea vaginae]